MDDEFDLDVDNYSRDELLGLCDIPGDDSDVSIIKATNTRIIQYNDNPAIKQFFQSIQDKLLNKNNQEGFENWHDVKNVEEVEEDQEDDAFDQEEDDEEESPFQKDNTIGKELDARQVYRHQHEIGSEPPVPSRSGWKLNITDKTTSSLPVQQQSYLGAREVKQVPYAQGTINPRVKNKTQRLINLDSQYRSMPGGVFYRYPTPGCSTNYSVTLSESLKNTMAISLNSYEIPYSWVGIDPARGNNKLAIKIECDGESPCWACVTFNAGNWSLNDINDVLAHPSLPASPHSPAGSWSYDCQNACCSSVLPCPPPAAPTWPLKLEVTSDGFIKLLVDTASSPTFKLTVYFWGVEVEKNCSHNCTAISNNYQNSLGWLLGFRTQSVIVYDSSTSINGVTACAFPVWARNDGIIGPSTASATAPATLDGWKMTQYIPYLYIVLEDHNKNHNNKGVLNIIPAATVLNLPSYAKPTGMTRNKTTGVIEGGVCDTKGAIDEPQDYYVNGEIVGGIYKDPQHLTQAQLYTIASIKNNRTFRSPYSVPTGPSDSDILAKIILPDLEYKNYGKYITGYGSSLELNTRAYFGPVDLDRFTIKLIDNNGNLINLNNRDWSFTLRVEQLYQF